MAYTSPRGRGPEATETELANTTVSQAYGHRHNSLCNAKCCLEFTTRGGYRMFPGLSRLAHPHPSVPVSHEACTLGLVYMLPHSLWLAGPFLTLSPAAMTTATHNKYGPLPPPVPHAQKPCAWLVQGQSGSHLSKFCGLPLSYSPQKPDFCCPPPATCTRTSHPNRWTLGFLIHQM